MKKFRTPVFFRWIFFRRIWGFSSNNEVYLTFDDGPTSELTEWILDYLKENGVRATFFCVGSNVRSHPDLYKKILREGHLVGNHTMAHEKGTRTSHEVYLHSIHEASGCIDSDLFRPPYGRVPMTLTKKIRRKYKIIMWTWLSYDYDKSVALDEIIRSAERDIKAGDILVLHDNAKVTERLKVLLPAIIKAVKQKGLKFGLISV